VDPDTDQVFDAAGRGIGCQAGIRKYKGPGLPKDPPWPPGAEPTPSPTPSPSPAPSISPDGDAAADASADPSPGLEAEAGTPTILVAATNFHLMQADLAAGPAPTPRPRNTLLPGIDVSHHNGDIDYQKVRQAGQRFVFIKATQDNDFIDPMFPTNLARARAAGLAAGAYHFFDYTLDGKAQADHFLDRVESVGGIDDALPPVVDVECWAPIGASIHAVSSARLRDFVQRVYERTGRIPIVYTSVHMWREVVGNAEGFEDLPLWAACWGCDVPPSLAPGWGDWAFWQTGISRIPGVGRLDGNYFSGSKKDLKAMKLRPFAIADDAPATTGGRVELDLGGRDATHIRTSSDGETWSEWGRIRSTPAVQIPTDEGEYAVFAQFRMGPGLKSPIVSDSIVVDHTPPHVSRPTVSLREGPIGVGPTAIPVSVGWDARDQVAGLSDATVAVACGDSQTQRTEAPGSAAPGELATWSADAALFEDANCDVTAIGRDGAGNTSRATTRDVRASVIPTADAAPAATVTADQVGVIARRGPDGGRAAVLLDGVALTLVDLYSPEPGSPEIVSVLDLTDGEHAIAIEDTGSSDPASADSVVTIDGFATLERQP
jgi:GH25 family lysozyme M1 (1,4-beta-N-acetylmuramidase)